MAYQYFTKAHRNDKVSQLEIENNLIAYESAIEGIVLLENSDVLPLETKRIALYGAGGKYTIKGGTGSGEVNERKSLSIYEGLINAGFTITTDKYLSDFDTDYNSYLCQKIKLKNIASLRPNPYPFGRLITIDDVNESDTDTAIYVVSRQAGEGGDKKIEKGDFDLDKIEISNIKFLTENYKNTVLVINSGSCMNLSTIDEFHVGAIIFFAQQGQAGGTAFADIITGKVSPSAKLTDSWVNSYKDVPYGDKYSYMGDLKNQNYNEGIYVGYRYFDSFNVNVRYPFGFGLSYTEFSIDYLKSSYSNNIVTLSIDVMNRGFYSGKEVVQVYASLPDGKLKKESKRLIAFKKTKILKPGESEELSISFPLDYLKSYDESIASFIIEKGEYLISVGSSVVSNSSSVYLSISEDIIVSKNINICVRDKKIEEISPLEKEIKHIDTLDVINISPENYETEIIDYSEKPRYSSKEIDEYLNKLSLKKKCDLLVGTGFVGMIHVNKNHSPGTVGSTTNLLYKEGIINVNLSDGPAGLRLLSKSAVRGDKVKCFEGQSFLSLLSNIRILYRLVKAKDTDATYYQYCTAFPVGVSLAQTWNTELVERVGAAISKEMCEYNITYFLGPALNIHKNPLCGRNFEYYSEDPVLAGKIASSIVRGVESIDGNYAVIKHFACNNQEDNRTHSSSNVNERALREIYLRAFEIVVKEAKVKSIMTSYNKVNDVYTPNSFDLCTNVLRHEWGFDGVVMTDWFSTGKSRGNNYLAIKAGNDLIMPGGKYYYKELLRGVKKNKVSIEEIDRACANVLREILESYVNQNYREEILK